MRRHHISSSGSSSPLLFSIAWRGDEIPYDFSKFMYTDNCTFGDLADHAYTVISGGSTPSSNGLGYIVDNYGTNPLYILSGGYLKNSLGITEDTNGNEIIYNYVYIYSPLVTDYIGTFCFPIKMNEYNYVYYLDNVNATLNYFIYVESSGGDEGGEGGESSGGDEGSVAIDTGEGSESGGGDEGSVASDEGGESGVVDEGGEGEEPSEEEQE